MKTILTLLVLLITTGELFSQDIKTMSLGPSALYKAGVSAVNTPKGRKNGVGFNGVPDFGASFYLPMSTTSNLGLDMEMGYSSYSYILKSAHNDDEFQFNHSYFTINPNFYFGGFLLGFSFGLPISSDYDGTEVKTSTQNTFIEVKIGGMIPIFKDETGELNFVIMGGYALTPMYSDYVKNDPLNGILPTDELIHDKHNPRIASLGMGFNFLFNLKKKPVEPDTMDEAL